MGSFRFKLLLLFGTSITLVAAAGSFGAAWLNRQALKTEIQAKLVSVASTAAAMIDAKAHEALRVPSQMNDPAYLRLVMDMREILRRTEGLKFIYTLRPVHPSSLDTTSFRFVLDGGAKDKPLDFEADEFSKLGDIYGSLPPVARRVLITGIAAADEDPVADEWGLTLSGYAPILDAEGKAVAILGVDMMASQLEASLMPIYWVAFGTLGFSFLIGMALTTTVGRWVLRPVEHLTDGARRIMRGELDEPVPVKGRDDLAEVLHTFNDMMISIKESQETIRHQTYLNSQLEIAASIQKHLLRWPHLDSPDVGVRIDVRTADSTGGDWAQFFQASDKDLWLLVGDVMGHGVGSAMVAATVAGAFEALKPELARRASIPWLLSRLNDVVLTAGHGELLMTLAVAHLDVTTGELRFASAGHPLPRVVTFGTAPKGHNKVRTLIARGNPLGFGPAEYGFTTDKLVRGEAMVMISDGVLDRRDSEGQAFGGRRFSRILKRTANQKAADLTRELVEACLGIHPDEALDDDVSVLVVSLPLVRTAITAA